MDTLKLKTTAFSLVIIFFTIISYIQFATAAPQIKLTKGINLSNWFINLPIDQRERTNFINEKDFKRIQMLGFNFIRLPIDPLLFLSNNSLDRKKLLSLDRALDLAQQYNLAVIVDIQPPEEYKYKVLHNKDDLYIYAKFLTEISKHLKIRDPKFVAIELMNEPHFPDQSLESQTWDIIQKQLWQAVRTGNPKITIIATGAQWGSVAGLVNTNLLPDSNIIYTFHFYEPFEFTHQGACWVNNPAITSLHHVPYPATPEKVSLVIPSIIKNINNDDTKREVVQRLTGYGDEYWDKDKLKKKIEAASQWASYHDVPIFLGEFGTHNLASPLQDRHQWLQDVRQICDELHIGWSMWDYNQNFGFYDPEKNTIDWETINALGLLND